MKNIRINLLSNEIPWEQASFIKERGTGKQIFNVRLLIEKARGYNFELVLYFVDYKTVFNYVRVQTDFD